MKHSIRCIGAAALLLAGGAFAQSGGSDEKDRQQGEPRGHGGDLLDPIMSPGETPRSLQPGAQTGALSNRDAARSSLAAPQFKGLDGNGDGYLNAAELRQAKLGDRMAALDADKDGRLSQAEFDKR